MIVQRLVSRLQQYQGASNKTPSKASSAGSTKVARGANEISAT